MVGSGKPAVALADQKQAGIEKAAGWAWTSKNQVMS
jgi:hypothetical protein